METKIENKKEVGELIRIKDLLNEQIKINLELNNEIQESLNRFRPLDEIDECDYIESTSTCFSADLYSLLSELGFSNQIARTNLKHLKSLI